MLQDTTTAENKYKEFAKKVIDSNLVWGLASNKGFAKTNSKEFEDAQVIPFWDDKTLAAAMSKDNLNSYEPTAMPLSDFLENWLVGMYNEGHLVGVNWDAKKFEEVEPLDLALEIANQSIANGKDLDLKKYKDIKDFQVQVSQVLESE